MDRNVAKEFLHIRDWLSRAKEIVAKGKDAYLEDDLLQEAGDSLMMKLGEASNPTVQGRPGRSRVAGRHRQPQLADPPIRRGGPSDHLGNAVP